MYYLLNSLCVIFILNWLDSCKKSYQQQILKFQFSSGLLYKNVQNIFFLIKLIKPIYNRLCGTFEKLGLG